MPHVPHLGHGLSSFDGASGNIAYSRSAAGEITSVTNQSYTDSVNSPNLVNNVANGVNGPTSWSFGNGLTGVRHYDSSGRVNGLFVCNGSTAWYCGSGSALVYSNTVDWKGVRVVSPCDLILNQCSDAHYDDFNRLVATGGPVSYSYAYDRWGNRTYANGATYSYDGNNHQVGLSYDAAGNQTSDGVHTYTYDADGKVLQVDGGTTAKYVYDVMDQRVRITTQSDDNEYLFDPFGRRQSSWIVGNNFGNEGRIYWDYGLLANRSQNGQTYFHHGNYLGTERVRTNYQGQAVDTVTSGPYGENFQQNTSDGSSTQDNNGYTSQEHDSLTGTDHFLYRQYQGTLGRWMSPDPYDGSYHFFNPQSLNRYAYTLGNPLGLIDLLGLDYLCAPVWEETYDGNGGVVATKIAEECVDEGGGGSGGGFVGAAEGGTGGGDGGAIGANPYAPNDPAQPTACQQTILNAVNDQFGTNLTAQNILPTSDPNPTAGGGQVNVNFGGGYGLSAAQLNAIQSGRYAPRGFFGFITGYGPSLHVVAGPSELDPTAGTFQTSNLGGGLTSLDLQRTSILHGPTTPSGRPYIGSLMYAGMVPTESPARGENLHDH